ncbi:MAG: adenylate/guanylate cyclase domain-containing protein [Candidatus Nitrosocaldus sp.]
MTSPDTPTIPIRSDTLVSIKARVMRTVRLGPQIEAPFKLSERFLRRHINERLRMAVLIADIAESTRLSLELPSKILATVIQVFSQEMALLVIGHGGYVLKYVGDAVLSFFPAEYNPTIACTTAAKCAINMMSIVNDAINPALIEMGYPSIHTKIGIDFGQNLIMIYGKSNEESYVDIIGPAVSMASKITSIAGARQLIVGQDAYAMLDEEIKGKFVEFNVNTYRWGFIDPVTRDPYKLYLYSPY